jgi:pimeloyl-ACP methyl ester carboxylesterase
MTGTRRPFFGSLGNLADDGYGTRAARPPLLLLHCLTYDRRQRGPLLDALALKDPDRRILALDLPGHAMPSAQEAAGQLTAAITQAV